LIREAHMRTQPQDVITKLEADNSRLAKEAVLLEAMQEGLDEFFEGVTMALDPLVTCINYTTWTRTYMG
jgi:DNA ligase-1